MKNKYLIIAFTLLSIITQAQPVIHSADMMPVFGSQFSSSTIEFTDVSNETGASMVWDYSDLEVSVDIGTFTIVDATETENSDLFPDAEFAWQSDSVNQYGSIANDDQMDFGLSAFAEEGESLLMIYSDPKQILSYPLTMGGSGVDSYEGELLVNSEVFSVIEGTYSWMVDGYGTLITHHGTFTNVLRVSNFYQETTTISFGEFDLTSTSEVEQYAYYTAGYAFPLAVFTSVTETDNEGNEEEYSDAMISNPGTASGVNDISEKIDLSLFPNPCDESVKINLSNVDFSLDHISFFDVTGRLVKMIHLNEFIHKATSIEINISDLPAAVYIVNAYDAEAQLKASSKLIKN